MLSRCTWSLLFLFFWACTPEGAEPEIKPSPPLDPNFQFGQVNLVQENWQNTPLVVVASVEFLEPNVDADLDGDLNQNLRWNFAMAFDRRIDDVVLSFQPVDGQLPIVMEDTEGNRWDFWGRAISGPRQGAQLNWLNSGLGYWFTFGTLYDGPDIYLATAGPQVEKASPAPNWDVPTQTIVDAAGFNAIPALDEPVFAKAKDPAVSNYLDAAEMIVGIQSGEEVRAYPHPILDWHEIVNDSKGEDHWTLSYCPLTGTSKAYQRNTESENTFGVSGFLYDSNLMPYDRISESIWLQLEGRAVHGARRGERLTLRPFIEMPWELWQSIYPKASVLSSQTGFARDYTSYPYGDYRTNNDFIFSSILYLDDRLPAKERVFSVIVDGQAKVYRKTHFGNR